MDHKTCILGLKHLINASLVSKMALDRQYKDDVELEVFEGEIDDPDSPLPPPANMDTHTKPPRWLSHRTTRWREVLRYVLEVTRPRLTWRYVLVSGIVLYVSYCFIRGSPLFASKLPKYTGQHEVGTIDLEIPLDTPRMVSNTQFKDGRGPAFQMETVLFSIYYPAIKGASSSKRHPWIPKPISLRAEGFARVIHMNNFIVRPIFRFALWMIAGGIEIPAKVDVPILGTTEENDQDAYPVMVFSHGMISSRTDYTNYCGELASRGYIVAALEHRDGSCPSTTIRSKKRKDQKRFYFGEKQLRSDPPMKSAQLKKEQLAFRQAEIEETISVLRKISSGEGPGIYEQNLRKEGHCLHNWEDRIDMDHLVVGGHSYGATGALQALKAGPNSTTIPAIGGIALDPGKGSGPLNNDIDVPLLVIHSDSWSAKHTIFHGRPHFDTVKNLVQGVLDRVGASWFLTSLKTSHPSVTDAPLIEPLLLSWTTGATINVYEGLREYVKVSAEFFEYLKTGKREEVLAEAPTHGAYGKDDRDKERKKSMDKSITKYWQIHVAPPTV